MSLLSLLQAGEQSQFSPFSPIQLDKLSLKEKEEMPDLQLPPSVCTLVQNYKKAEEPSSDIICLMLAQKIPEKLISEVITYRKEHAKRSSKELLPTYPYRKRTKRMTFPLRKTSP